MNDTQISEIRTQVIENLEALKSKGYDTGHWDVEGFVTEAADYMEETGNTTAEIRYDGIKFFTVSI